MSKIAAIAKLTAQSGKRDELVTAFKPLLDAVQEEAGTLVYILHKDNGDEDVLWFYEVYTDDAALAAHSKSDTFKSLGPALAPLLAGRPEMNLLSPVSIKGL
ncbi:MAG TPA: putative quinol monooxygenase [Acidimicrobiales bacterium]|nr:putative quinol monooxygenase [Acidimicrobiales bacterium]